jgi:hypothetical protein
MLKYQNNNEWITPSPCMLVSGLREVRKSMP